MAGGLVTRRVPTRDGFFDLVRSAALVRVVLWHTFAAGWLTWAFPAMPAMFFVAGVMLAQSLERADYLTVLRGRARRMLLPMWALGLIVAAAALVEAARTTGVRLDGAALGGLVRWAVPLTDPPGPDWQGGWLTSHLWYLRAYLWMVLAGPVIVRAARRARLAVPLLVAGIALVELAHRVGVPLVGSGPGRIALGDATCYGLFALLGAVWHHRRRRGAAGLSPRLLVAASVGLAAAAVAVAGVGGLPSGVVNDSYPVLALLGAAWLGLVLAAERPLRALADRPRVTRLARRLNGRAVTIYLWHPVAIVAALAIAPALGGAAAGGLRLAVTAGGTFLAVAVFGWVEDVAAGRRAALRHRAGGGAAPLPVPALPRLAPALVAVVVTALAVPTWLGASATSPAGGALPPPSDRTALADAAFSGSFAVDAAAADAGFGGGAVGGLPDEDRLREVLEAWLLADPEATFAQVAIRRDGEVRSATAGLPGAELPEGDEVALLSITKLYTATLVLQEVAAGRIDLDAPMPDVAGVAPLDVVVTPRMLLRHASGLENYPDVAAYDPSRVYTPAEAVSLATTAPLRFAPGTGVHYSNANFLWLGLLLEQVTGEPFEALVRTRLSEPLGFEHTRLDTTSVPGWVPFSSGGVVATPDEAARFVDELVGRAAVVPPDLLADMLDVEELNAGLGAWPMCPCGTDETGAKRYAAIGHTNGWGGVYHYLGDGTTVFLRVGPAPANSTQVFEAVASAVLAA